MANRIPKASIIVVSYNDFNGTTGPCLSSLQQDVNFCEFEIIIVDNGSDEETLQCINCIKPVRNLKILKNNSNLGFAQANNIGVRYSSAPVLIFLNSDTIVPTGAIGALCSKLEKNPKWGAVGPITNSVGNEQLLSCAGKNTEEILKESLLWIKNSKQSHFQTTQLSFFCVALSKVTWDCVGPLDETFGLGYYEDVDYCIRMSMAGKTMHVLEDIFIYHKGSKSFSRTPKKVKELMKRNRKILLKKFGSFAKKHLIHLRDANLNVLSHYLEIFSCKNSVEIRFRFEKRFKLAKEQMPKGLIKKIRYQRKLSLIKKKWIKLNH